MASSMIVMDFLFYNQFRWIRKWHFAYKMRTEGVFATLGPNELAAFYAQYTMVLLGIFLFDKNRWRKILIGGIVMLNAYCIIYSFSRAAYLSTFLASAFLLFFAKKKLLVIFVISINYILHILGLTH